MSELDDRIRSTVVTMVRAAPEPHAFDALVTRDRHPAPHPSTRGRNVLIGAVVAVCVLAAVVGVSVAVGRSGVTKPVHRPAPTLPVGAVQYLRFRYTQQLDVRCAGTEAPHASGRFDTAVVEVWRAADRTRQRVTYPDGTTRDSIVVAHGPEPTHFRRGTGLAMRTVQCADGITGTSGSEPPWYPGWSAPKVVWPDRAARTSRPGSDRRGRSALVHRVTTPGEGCSSPTTPAPGVACRDTPGATSVATVTVKSWFVDPTTHLPLEIRRVEQVGARATGRSWLVRTTAGVLPSEGDIFSTLGSTPERSVRPPAAAAR